MSNVADCHLSPPPEETIPIMPFQAVLENNLRFVPPLSDRGLYLQMESERLNMEVTARCGLLQALHLPPVKASWEIILRDKHPPPPPPAPSLDPELLRREEPSQKTAGVRFGAANWPNGA